ncbi:MAG: hypothetical protein RLZZ502_928 [Pseudomonadota bacterium]|jgi:hypothetical protein
MKATLDIADTLFFEAKEIVKRDMVTMRALVERGLRLALAEHKQKPKRFKLADKSVGGKGLSEHAQSQGGFAALRDLANER